MIDISQKVLGAWQGVGIDLNKIKSEPFEVDAKGLLLLDEMYFKFDFKIIDEYDDEFWSSLVKNSLFIDCMAGNLTYRAGLAKKRYDPIGVYTHADCYIQFIVKIDEDKVTDELLEQMTKPEFIRDGCDKSGDVLKGKKKKGKKKAEPETIEEEAKLNYMEE